MFQCNTLGKILLQFIEYLVLMNQPQAKSTTFSPQNRPHLTHKIDHIFFRQSMFQNNKVIKLFLLFIQCLGAYRVGHLAPLALICDAPYQNQALLAILSLVTNPVCNFVENF